MTRLRKMMLEELQRRNYAADIARYYIRPVADFARYFHRPPDRLRPEHIREYQAHLFSKRKLSPGSVTQRQAALRFFFIQTLKKPWSVADTILNGLAKVRLHAVPRGFGGHLLPAHCPLYSPL